jgi:uncharacterized phiE125 gp8 family phage protein
MLIETLVPPGAEPVSVAEARDFVRAGHSDEDALLATLIAAARAQVERETGLALVSRRVRVVLDGLPEAVRRTGVLALPIEPISAFMSAGLIQADGAEADVTAAFVLARPDRLVLSPWAASGLRPGVLAEGLRLTLEVGFGPPDAVPGDLRLAVLRGVAAAYTARVEPEAREASTAAVTEALGPWRRVRL